MLRCRLVSAVVLHVILVGTGRANLNIFNGRNVGVLDSRRKIILGVCEE